MDYLPYNIEEQNVTPVYETLPGWRGDLTGVTDEKALPKELKSYIKYIEDALGVPVADSLRRPRPQTDNHAVIINA